jgi:hypothetical protein
MADEITIAFVAFNRLALIYNIDFVVFVHKHDEGFLVHSNNTCSTLRAVIVDRFARMYEKNASILRHHKCIRNKGDGVNIRKDIKEIIQHSTKTCGWIVAGYKDDSVSFFNVFGKVGITHPGIEEIRTLVIPNSYSAVPSSKNRTFLDDISALEKLSKKHSI